MSGTLWHVLGLEYPAKGGQIRISAKYGIVNICVSVNSVEAFYLSLAAVARMISIHFYWKKRLANIFTSMLHFLFLF